MAGQSSSLTNVAAATNDDSNRLIVARASPNTHAQVAVAVSQAKLDSLGISEGDAVLLTGKCRHKTVSFVVTDEQSRTTTMQEWIKMNPMVQNNLRVKIGDAVTMERCPEIQYGKRVLVLPLDADILPENFYNVLIKPYFDDAYRPVHEGDIIPLKVSNNKFAKFEVVETDPSPFCIVAPNTKISTTEALFDEVSVNGDSMMDTISSVCDTESNGAISDSVPMVTDQNAEKGSKRTLQSSAVASTSGEVESSDGEASTSKRCREEASFAVKQNEMYEELIENLLHGENCEFSLKLALKIYIFGRTSDLYRYVKERALATLKKNTDELQNLPEYRQLFQENAELAMELTHDLMKAK